MSEVLVKVADPQYLVCGSFKDLEELSEATKGWDLDFRQLDAGDSRGDVVQLAEPQTALARIRLNRRYHQRGSSPPGIRTFALLEEGVSDIRWCGRDVSESALMTFHPGGDFDGVSQPGFEVYTLSFSEKRLAETATTLDLPEIRDLIGDSEKMTRCERSALQDLRHAVRLLCKAVEGGLSTLGAPWLRRQLEFEIPARVLGALASSRAEAPRLPSRLRDRALRRALSFIEEDANSPLAVRDLCRAAGVSWRTLDYAFRAHFGVTPKAYLKAIRLNAVRRELRCAEPPPLVTDVANRWGFWHMGQFAADYRRLFGELPSQTSARSRSRRALPA
jgi:AraC-like DNA-binding protein